MSRGLTSWLYSRNTWKLRSFLRTGWAAMRHRKTSCMATVFLKMARYSLREGEGGGSGGSTTAREAEGGRNSRLQLLLHLGELLLRHGSFSLSELLQLLSGRIEVRPRGGRGDLSNSNNQVKISSTPPTSRPSLQSRFTGPSLGNVILTIILTSQQLW